MRITKVVITPPQKNGALASATVELLLENKDTIKIADLRILRNAQGDLWLGFPTRNVDGKYTQTVFVCNRLKRQIDDAVLSEFERQLAQNGGAL